MSNTGVGRGIDFGASRKRRAESACWPPSARPRIHSAPAARGHYPPDEERLCRQGPEIWVTDPGARTGSDPWIRRSSRVAEIGPDTAPAGRMRFSLGCEPDLFIKPPEHAQPPGNGVTIWAFCAIVAFTPCARPPEPQFLIALPHANAPMAWLLVGLATRITPAGPAGTERRQVGPRRRANPDDGLISCWLACSSVPALPLGR